MLTSHGTYAKKKLFVEPDRAVKASALKSLFLKFSGTCAFDARWLQKGLCNEGRGDAVCCDERQSRLTVSR